MFGDDTTFITADASGDRFARWRRSPLEHRQRHAGPVSTAFFKAPNTTYRKEAHAPAQHKAFHAAFIKKRTHT